MIISIKIDGIEIDKNIVNLFNKELKKIRENNKELKMENEIFDKKH